MSEPMLDRHIRRLERRVLALTSICAALTCILIWTLGRRAPGVVATGTDRAVLRVKGLIIEDDHGRARILLGAPFPTVPDRRRQDATTTSLVFLDAQGHDRVSIGEVMPAQIDGQVPAHFHRIGGADGLTIFDTSGNEPAAWDFCPTDAG